MRPSLFLSLSLSATLASAASYIVPQTYDNYINATNSSGYAVIRQDSPSLSTASYTIGGASVKYRCATVPKITCRSSPGPRINATISEINLRHPVSGESVNVFGSDLRLEQDAGAGGNFYICAAAYGGMTFDNLDISATSTTINYTYQGNKLIQAYHFFTSNNPETTVRSYISATYNQTCQ